MLSVHMNIWLTVTVSAQTISFFSRAAIRAACNSKFGTVTTFVGATRFSLIQTQALFLPRP